MTWQPDGAIPLHIASRNGLVECVQALLDRGAAINQAKVGCASSIACHCIAGAVCVCILGEPACKHALAYMGLQLVGCAGMARVGGF